MQPIPAQYPEKKKREKATARGKKEKDSCAEYFLLASDYPEIHKFELSSPVAKIVLICFVTVFFVQQTFLYQMSLL